MSDIFGLHVKAFHVPINGLAVPLTAVSENPPACALRKPVWDGFGPLTDHAPTVEEAEEQKQYYEK
jgi:hypothetical protein